MCDPIFIAKIHARFADLSALFEAIGDLSDDGHITKQLAGIGRCSSRTFLEMIDKQREQFVEASGKSSVVS
jgi:hypothetical protein